MKSAKAEAPAQAKKKNEVKIEYGELLKGVAVLRSINHKLRKEIIQLLANEGPMTVTDIFVQMRLEQSVASQHLAILRSSGVLITERTGKFIRYRVNHDRIAEIRELVNKIAG